MLVDDKDGRGGNCCRLPVFRPGKGERIQGVIMVARYVFAPKGVASWNAGVEVSRRGKEGARQTRMSSPPKPGNGSRMKPTTPSESFACEHGTIRREPFPHCFG